MNFDKKTKLTNVFEKIFDNDEIQKKISWISKNNLRKLSTKQKRKNWKNKKTQLSQLNCMLRRRIFNAQIKQKKFKMIF